MPLPPQLARFLRFALIACGALAVISATINLIAGMQLEPSDLQSLGITRNSLVAYFATQLLAGVAMLFFGFRRRK